MAVKGRIQILRGLKADFDPSKLRPGEWAASIDSDPSNQIVWMCFAAGVVKRMGTYEDFKKQIAEATSEIKEEYLAEFQTILDQIEQLAEQTSTNTDTVVTIRNDFVNTYLPQMLEFFNSTKQNAESASTSASEAKTSETNAKTSEVNAAASASTASSKASAAATSESNAASSASIASKKASEAAASATNSANSATSASDSASTASSKATAALNSAEDAANSATTASDKAIEASNYATEAKSYTHGGTGTRDGEDTDNAEYYYQQSKSISESFAGALRPMGTVSFANLPALSTAVEGDMYNVSDEFTTTSLFKEGSGNVIPAGANVYKTADNLWDVLAGSPVTGIKGDAETSYRRGNVNITKENMGIKSANNLTTTAEGYFLDARQGKVLDDKIANLDYVALANSIGWKRASVMSVTYSDLGSVYMTYIASADYVANATYIIKLNNGSIHKVTARVVSSSQYGVKDGVVLLGDDVATATASGVSVDTTTGKKAWVTGASTGYTASSYAPLTISTSNTVIAWYCKIDDTVKDLISSSSAITDTGQYALDAREKNASVSGTLANQIRTHSSTSASTSNYGHVKLTASTAVTNSTGLALPVTEKNASIEGTLANQISKNKWTLVYEHSITGWTSGSVSIDLSGYTEVRLICANYSSQEYLLPPIECNVGESVFALGILNYTITSRQFSFSSTGMTVQNGIVSGGTTNVNVCVPYRVYAR